ncbi:type I secretion target GGXGXDXXX repeat protein domain protein [Synechococcus sp. PCC 7335]|uniref:calcium-binding protein n=1 Tax=Synechococcus sp. (strain ATCC 29403 / PCC 7335) TaxID=91464 RepID=UPI00017EE7E7|nr:calcium-binding protein [Synechococcus sp. PCC 7335]EDX84101.1 type I secretion target GGXGXDXXX repeat protein domain protein [Synechococcus sp. PCC 7335]
MSLDSQISAPFTYDEAVDGDLPSGGNSPDFAFGVGTNIVIGETSFSNNDAPVPIDTDFDAFSFHVPAGTVLESVSLDIGLLPVGAGTFSQTSIFLIGAASVGGNPKAQVDIPSKSLNLFNEFLPLASGRYKVSQGSLAGVLDAGEFRTAKYTFSIKVSESPLSPINGTNADDKLLGSSRIDIINGFLGKDQLVGKAGNDLLNGDGGNDRLFGNGGNDKLFGGNGRDKLDGGGGDDLLNGGIGNDKLFGKGGNDNLIGGRGRDFLNGGVGNDLLDGGVGNDHLFGGGGADRFVLRAGDGLDTITAFRVGVDEFILDGINSVDILITQGLGGTLISLTDTNEQLAFVEDIQANELVGTL